MSLWNAFLLGVIQGITEFLPISSSGHLVVTEAFMHLGEQNLKSFDIAVHFGTLLAILLYFRKDIWRLIQAFFYTIGSWVKIVPAHRLSEQVKSSQKLLGYLLLSSVPAIVVGVTLSDFLDEHFRNPQSVGVLMVVVAGVFVAAEYFFSKAQHRTIGLKEAILMGIAQSLALIPGVSRSGITISAGLSQGVKREEAARFSFLLGAIAIFGATLFGIVAVMKGKYSFPGTDVLLVGISSSFVVGLGAISFLMHFLKKHTLHVFAIYRVLLGSWILYYFLR